MASKYAKAVHWIADNDEGSELDCQVMSSLVSVVLIADLFDKEPEAVAKDVVRIRHCERLGTTHTLPKRLAA